VIKRLAFAYDAFFRRIKRNEKPGFPRFKGKNRYDSFTLRQTGWKLNGRYLVIRNIGTFKLRLSRLIEGNIKTVTIRRNSTSKWYVSFACENVPTKTLPESQSIIGIDVGLENFATLSNSSTIENPRYFKNGHDILRKRQQSLSRKVKGSNRRNKARILVAKAHEKVKNQRRDFRYKTATTLLREYGTVCIEDMKSWNGFKNLNKSMRDASWFEFFNILCFKAEDAGRTVIKVPARGTSQLCSQCGARVPKDLSVRIHSCPHCGLTIHRDYNSALNILQAGQASHSLSAPASGYHL